MARGYKDIPSIINYVQLVLALIIGGLLGDMMLFMVTSKLQVVYMVTYGYLIIIIILVASIFLKEDIPKKVRLIIAGSAILFYITSGALLLDSAIKTHSPSQSYQGLPPVKIDIGRRAIGHREYRAAASTSNEHYNRSITAGVFSIFLAILYGAEGYFAFKGK